MILDQVDLNQNFSFKAVIEMQDDVVLTSDNYGLVIVGLMQSLNEGSYELGNITLNFANKNYYFSERFSYETPLERLVTVYLVFGDTDVEIARGIVNNISLTPIEVSLQLLS